MVNKPINIILHVEVNYNRFYEDYQNKFLDRINLDEIKDKLEIPNIDRLTFNDFIQIFNFKYIFF